MISVSFSRFLYVTDQLGGDLAVLVFFLQFFAVFGQLWGVLGGFQRVSLSFLTVFLSNFGGGLGCFSTGFPHFYTGLTIVRCFVRFLTIFHGFYTF